MQIIQAAHESVVKTVGHQQINVDVAVRPLQFVFTWKVDDGVLYYNLLTREMVLLTPEEAAEAATLPPLREGWFFVPEAFDDRAFADQVRALFQLTRQQDKAINTYCIYTTSDCNARCYYCFERGIKKVPMTMATAERVARYIHDHAEGKEVNLFWFGGEPLYNVGVIDLICRRLTEMDVKFHSKMITNGYLFDAEMVRRAVNDWHLRRAQITLDGTEKVYNRSKHYIYQGVNAFERVLDNIGLLLQADITVPVRLNLSLQNGEDLLQLVDVLNDRFGGNRKIEVYCHALFNKTGKGSDYTAEDYRQLYEQQRTLEKKLRACRLDGGVPLLNNELKVYKCISDNPNAVTILQNGQFVKCNNYFNSHFIGDLDSTSFDAKELRFYAAERPRIAACKTCGHYPDCRVLACCTCDPCTPWHRKEKDIHVHQQMYYSYALWKRENASQMDNGE
ncbi:radical SAM protein [Prevotella sp. AGR2160]|uniref:radical SAM protein n=1 Tax=Prevotella sp. AGR2160 TaxID=1280674 RepID=UPI00040D804E|nr:radical SAM protein [Prevotella sp. AGR2160]